MLTLSSLPNGSLWRDFGIVLERGQGPEMFLFDKAKGTHLEDNLAHLNFLSPGIAISHSGGVDYCWQDELAEKLDSLLFHYFFGETSSEEAPEIAS